MNITELVQKIVRGIMHIFCIFPVKKNRIIFNSQKGTQYACNPRSIYEFLLAKYGNHLDYVWCLNKPSKSLRKHESLKIVRYNSLKYFFYQMTSKVIVANIPSPCYLPKRKRQIMIDTWHGGGAYKRIGTSVPKQSTLSATEKKIVIGKISNNYKWELYKAYYNALDTTFFISSSRLFTEVMFESQKIPRDAYLEVGMPRNDIFFKDNSIIAQKTKKRLGIGSEKKVLLFAPTYRGNVKDQHYSMNLDIQMCLDAAKARWGGDWVFVYRVHIHSNSLDKEKIPDHAVNASKYDEMQELLCMADVFITDYSSSQWDFALTKKPAFLFTPDLNYYECQDRGFYTSINDWAFPYAKTNEELAKLITSFDEEIHLRKVQRHLNMLGSCENGDASEKICKIIAKKMNL